MDKSGEYNTRNDVNDIVDIVMKEIKESNEYAQMGTGIDEGMTRMQMKSLKEELGNLLSVLNSFGKEMNDTMTKKDFFNFYQQNKERYNWPEFDFNDDYVDSILTIFNHNNKYSISVKELIVQTMLLEEKLKIKKAKLTQDYQNIKPKITEIQDQIRKHKSSSTNLPIHLGITIFEASNIEGSEIKEYYIQMNIENQTKTSSIVKYNDGMPIWNENQLITLKQRNQNLYLELYSKSFQRELVGTLGIVLEELDIEQQPVEQTYNLSSPNKSNPPVGSLRLKFHYVYNRAKYFENVLQKAQIQKTKLEEYLNILEPFDNYYQSPFGIIMSDQIKMILDFNRKTIFQKATELDIFSPNLRQSVLRATHYEMQRNTSSVNQINPDMSTISLICICSSLFLSYWCMYIKSDLITFLFVLWALFQYKIPQLLSGAMFYAGLSGLITSEVIDLIFLISSYKSCWLELNRETPSGLYNIAYLFTLINMIVKGQIIFGVLKTKKKSSILPE